MIDAKGVASLHNVVDVLPRFLSVIPDGSTRVRALCPFHDDHKMSLIADSRRNRMKCFACGWGGNSIAFVMEYMNKTFPEAVDILHSQSGGVGSVVKQTLKTTVNEYAIVTPEWDATLEDAKHYKLGYPTNMYRYELENGYMYICRYETADGKEMAPLTFRKGNGKSKWMFKGLPNNRPLYRIKEALRHLTIVLVEGEKCVDALVEVADKIGVGVTTWMGGANSLHLTDFSTIRNSLKIYWPDNDAQGMSAMCCANHLIGDESLIMRIIPLNYALPKGYDCADSEWNEQTLKAHLDSSKYHTVSNTFSVIPQVGTGTMYEYGDKNGRWYFGKVKTKEQL